MATRRKKERWKAISGIVLIIAIPLGLFVGLWHHFNKPKHPADLVEFWSERYSSPEGQLEQALRTVIIPEIDFSDKPFAECLNFVLDELNRSGKSDTKTELRFLVSGGKLDKEITLKLTNVPASEAFRYVTSLAGAEYSVEGKGIIQIEPLEFSSSKTFEAKFFCLQSFYPSHSGKGPQSVVKELTNAGITFRPGDTADFYPEREVVIVSTTENQMELVDALFSSVCYFSEPTLYERISYRLQELFNPSPPPPPPPPPPPIPSGSATDPFGIPDPFATPGNPEADPFRAQ